jgi:tricorn protease
VFYRRSDELATGCDVHARVASLRRVSEIVARLTRATPGGKLVSANRAGAGPGLTWRGSVMTLRLSARGALLALALAASVTAARADRQPHARMLRYPDVSATHIVFAYANDLWLAPREGGLATLLASPPGSEGFPRFSPDGQTVAFVGNYDGNRDLYTVPVAGGPPTRVTHHPEPEILCDWTPDGKLLFFSSGYAGLARQQNLLTVAATGGMPELLPVPYGAFGAISPDGVWLAYTPHTNDMRTWKRYRGGMATDIWLFNLRDHTSKRVTTWEGTDTQPMWHGKQLYYQSDEGPEHKLNIWLYDPQTGKHEQITKFDDFDVKWPSIGPGPKGQGEIVFQNGSELFLLDLGTRQAQAVSITVPGAQPLIRPQRVEVQGQITGGDISGTGKRVLLEARGDLWSLPARNGSPRNLTRTSGVAERSAAWSPDGQWIAYFSDQTGEYELYVMPADGRGEPRQLTHDGHCFRMSTSWSWDGKYITFCDKTGAFYLVTVATGETKLIDQDPWTQSPTSSWSHNSEWIAYTRSGDNTQTAIWLYHVPTGAKHQVTSGMFNDSWPAFDQKGKYLFFASNRRFDEPIYEDIGTTFVYCGTDQLVVVPLREAVGSPLAPRSDEEPAKDEENKDEDKDKDKDKKKDAASQPASQAADSQPTTTAASQPDPNAPEADAAKSDKDKKDTTPLVIELDGFEQRAVPLPVKSGAFHLLMTNHEGKLLYVRRPTRGAEGSPSLKIFDLADEDKEEKTVIDGIQWYAMSGDHKKLLVSAGAYAVVDAAPGQKTDKPVSLDGMAATIDPRAEWKQLFTEAWRLQRDYFYVPNMHGVDWPFLREHYGAMLADCVSRADVGYVIRELISELNIGHAYYFDNGAGDEKFVPTGLLGCDFELADGAYRIKRILRGGAWDLDGRGPLAQPGVNVKEGDYLLAVNGVAIDVAKDPWAAFQGLGAGRIVTLTVSDQPTLETPAVRAARQARVRAQEKAEKAAKKDDKEEKEKPVERTGERDVVVKLIGNEADDALRYRAWVEHNRQYVARKSNNQVGYIHVPNTGADGQNELFRQFYGQRDKAALIIDERWNGGGQIPNRFIELLNRPITNYWARRDGRPWPNPPDAHQGPKCMLINGLAGSGGDAFPYYFRQSKLGKLIGMRTWGGLVGISGNPDLIDGAVVTVPTFGFYETDGTWGIEGNGVAPDLEVIDDPALMVSGDDPQLDAGVAQMLREIREQPYKAVNPPAPPDRKGMGVLEVDK